jgi:hypothetical protein
MGSQSPQGFFCWLLAVGYWLLAVGSELGAVVSDDLVENKIAQTTQEAWPITINQ